MTRFIKIKTLLFVIFLILPLQIEAQDKQNLSENADGSYVNNNGVNLWFRVEGIDNLNSIPIILIHGGPGATARPFEKTIGPELAKERRVIYMDYRGTGRSDRPTDAQKYSFEILASDIEAIRNELDIEKLSLFGHSNGAATAVTYARKYSEHVASLILCCPLLSPVDLEMNMIHKIALSPSEVYEDARTIYKSDQPMASKFGSLLGLINKETRYSFQYYNTDNSLVLNKIQDDFKEELGKDLMEPSLMKGLISNGFFEFDAFKYASELSMPVLLLLGRYDSEISLENSMKFALTVPDGYVNVLNESGHHPYVEQTKETVLEINTFINRKVDQLK